VFSIIYWVFTTYYFLAIRFLGFENERGIILSEDIYLQALIPGIIIGTLFGFRESTNLLKLKKRQSFIIVLIFNTILYTCFFVLVIFLTSLYGNSWNFAINFIISGIGISLLIHLSVFSLLFHFILQMNKKFGPGILLKYIIGNYFNPHEEERIFMFLDLKDSTAIAEKLEHISYSKLLQDCFAELTDSITKYKAQIYQYVGDEVVITWKIKQGVYDLNCIKFFFAFQNRLKDKNNYFHKSYDIIPEFKASIHCGNVTVAEVGILKTEIAYHGDTLNTASRIQGLCNDYKEQFLASEALLNHLTEESIFQKKFIGDLMLKGKEKTVKVFSISNSIEST
jgi:adenylate cyclase